MNALQTLHDLGQSSWLDHVARERFRRTYDRSCGVDGFVSLLKSWNELTAVIETRRSTVTPGRSTGARPAPATVARPMRSSAVTAG